MRALIPLLLEVEIMLEHLIAALRIAGRRERDLHVELAPSLLLDLERRALQGLLHALAKRFVEDVGGFFVAVGRDVFAVGAHEIDGDFPAAHREAFDFCWFIAEHVRVSGRL